MENKRKSINIIDIAIILALVSVIGGAIFRTYITRSIFPTNDTVTVEYTLEINNTDDNFIRFIENNDKIHLSSDQTFCGIVTKITSRPTKNYEKDADSKLIATYNIAKTDAILTVRADVTRDDSGYYIDNNKFIGVGVKHKYRTNDIEFDAQIKNVVEIQD